MGEPGAGPAPPAIAAMLIKVTDRLDIDSDDLVEEFVRSSGAGGQNVNKVATAVQLRFLAAGLLKLPDGVRERLVALAGRRATKAGEIVIMAQRFRTQELNRADATARLVALLRDASVRPAYRVATRPTRASVHRRLDAKRRQADRKRDRGDAGD